MTSENLACNCIDKLSNSVVVSDAEKEMILTKIGAFTPKPKFAKQIAMILLPIIMIITFFAAMENIDTVVGFISFAVFLVVTISLIFLYFLGGIYPYNNWKRCVKNIRNNDVFKVQVIPQNVWQHSGWYKDFFMEIIGENGEELGGSYLISRKLAETWDKVNVWAYFHKATDSYGKFDIYLVGSDTE